MLIATVPPLVAWLVPDGNLGFASWSELARSWVFRGLILLVIACPCALVLSTPITIVCGLYRASRLGALIKGGGFLEQLGQLRRLAFDKTGTLTCGKPQVVAVEPLGDLRRRRRVATGRGPGDAERAPVGPGDCRGGARRLARVRRVSGSFAAWACQARVQQQTLHGGQSPVLFGTRRALECGNRSALRPPPRCIAGAVGPRSGGHRAADSGCDLSARRTATGCRRRPCGSCGSWVSSNW